MDKARKVLIRKAITCGAVVGETPAEIEKDPDLIVAISDLILDVLMQFTSVMREATGDMAYFTPHWLLAEGTYKGDDVNPYAGLIVWRHIKDTYASVSVINKDNASQKLSQAMMVMVDQARNLPAYLGAVNDCINEYMKSGGNNDVVDDKVGIILEKFVVRESMSGLLDAEEWKAIGVVAGAKKKSREQGTNVTWNEVYMDLMRVCDQQLSGAHMHARKIRETGPGRGSIKMPDGVSFGAIDEDKINSGIYEEMDIDMALASMPPATMEDYRRLIDQGVALPADRMAQKLRDRYAQNQTEKAGGEQLAGRDEEVEEGEEDSEAEEYATEESGEETEGTAAVADGKEAVKIAAIADGKETDEIAHMREEVRLLRMELQRQQRAPDIAVSAISYGDGLGLASHVSFAAVENQHAQYGGSQQESIGIVYKEIADVRVQEEVMMSLQGRSSCRIIWVVAVLLVGIMSSACWEVSKHELTPDL